jgi:hypothetical protein
MAPGGKGGKRPDYGSKRRIRTDGYVDLYLPGHPLARKDGYVFEHRVVAWEAGLLTDPDKHIHHRENGDKAQNDVGNLEALTARDHQLEHMPLGAVIRNQHGEWIVGTGRSREWAERRAALGERSCEVCGTDITQLRIDATVCGNSCRVKRWKARQKASGKPPAAPLP